MVDLNDIFIPNPTMVDTNDIFIPNPAMVDGKQTIIPNTATQFQMNLSFNYWKNMANLAISVIFCSKLLEKHGQPCHFKYICVEALCSTRRLKLIEYRAFLARSKAEQQPSRVIHQLACFDSDRAVQCPNLNRKKSCCSRDQWLMLPHYPL